MHHGLGDGDIGAAKKFGPAFDGLLGFRVRGFRCVVRIGLRCWWAYAASCCRSASSTMAWSWWLRKNAGRLRKTETRRTTRARIEAAILIDSNLQNESESDAGCAEFSTDRESRKTSDFS